MSEEAWYLYMVECRDGTIYTGITNNVERRIAQHNNGTGAKYTKGRRPVRLLVSFQAPSKSTAAKYEYLIKKMSRKEKKEYIAQLQSLINKTS